MYVQEPSVSADGSHFLQDRDRKTESINHEELSLDGGQREATGSCRLLGTCTGEQGGLGGVLHRGGGASWLNFIKCYSFIYLFYFSATFRFSLFL